MANKKLNQRLEFSLYTPTITLGANVASATPYQWRVHQVSDTMAIVEGLVDLALTAAVDSVISFTLPPGLGSSFLNGDNDSSGQINGQGCAGVIRNTSATFKSNIATGGVEIPFAVRFSYIIN